jgi:hypothetical protein
MCVIVLQNPANRLRKIPLAEVKEVAIGRPLMVLVVSPILALQFAFVVAIAIAVAIAVLLLLLLLLLTNVNMSTHCVVVL